MLNVLYEIIQNQIIDLNLDFEQCRPSWLVDSNRIASKIRSASSTCDPEHIKWKSNPTKTCPNCHHIVENNDVNFYIFHSQIIMRFFIFSL